MKVKRNGIINKHFLTSLMFFLGVLMIVLTFITFLEDAQKHDKVFAENSEKNIKNNVKK